MSQLLKAFKTKEQEKTFYAPTSNYGNNYILSRDVYYKLGGFYHLNYSYNTF